MVFWLERAAQSSDANARLREISAHTEIVHPELSDGVWRATCEDRTTRDALVRRWGFHEVDAPPGQDRRGRVVVTYPRTVARGHSSSTRWAAETDEWAGQCWERFRAAHEDDGPPGARDVEVILKMTRAPLPAALIGPTRLAAVAIVIVVTDWNDSHVASVLDALHAAAELPGSGVVLVCNAPRAHKAMRAWRPPADTRQLLRRVYTENLGYAAACNAGLAAADATPFVLWTQVDARWAAGDVVEAMRASQRYGGACIGPSGGYLDDPHGGGVRERGRNTGRAESSDFAVDWIAGYWLLAPLAAVRAAAGWDEGYFLYYEDVDFSLRLAAAGSRPIVSPALLIDHNRNGTTRHLFTQEDRSEQQAESRERFTRIWGAL